MERSVRWKSQALCRGGEKAEITSKSYLFLSFEGIELLARIDNVLRHYNKKSNIIVFHDIEVHIEEMIIKKAGKTIDLTVTEFELAVFLIKNKNIVLSRERLVQEVWGYDYIGESRTIDNYIQKLRKKLDWRDRIKTIFKLGYRLEE